MARIEEKKKPKMSAIEIYVESDKRIDMEANEPATLFPLVSSVIFTIN